MITITLDRAGQPDGEGMLRVKVGEEVVLDLRYHDGVYVTGAWRDGGRKKLLRHLSSQEGKNGEEKGQ